MELSFVLGIAGNYAALERLIQVAEDLGVVDAHFYHSLLRAYCNGDLLPAVKSVLALVDQQGLTRDQRMYALVIKAYADKGRVAEVLHLEQDMQVRGLLCVFCKPLLIDCSCVSSVDHCL